MRAGATCARGDGVQSIDTAPMATRRITWMALSES